MQASPGQVDVSTPLPPPPAARSFAPSAVPPAILPAVSRQSSVAVPVRVEYAVREIIDNYMDDHDAANLSQYAAPLFFVPPPTVFLRSLFVPCELGTQFAAARQLSRLVAQQKTALRDAIDSSGMKDVPLAPHPVRILLQGRSGRTHETVVPRVPFTAAPFPRWFECLLPAVAIFAANFFCQPCFCGLLGCGNGWGQMFVRREIRKSVRVADGTWGGYVHRPSRFCRPSSRISEPSPLHLRQRRAARLAARRAAAKRGRAAVDSDDDSDDDKEIRDDAARTAAAAGGHEGTEVPRVHRGQAVERVVTAEGRVEFVVRNVKTVSPVGIAYCLLEGILGGQLPCCFRTPQTHLELALHGFDPWPSTAPRRNDVDTSLFPRRGPPADRPVPEAGPILPSSHTRQLSLLRLRRIRVPVEVVGASCGPNVEPTYVPPGGVVVGTVQSSLGTWEAREGGHEGSVVASVEVEESGRARRVVALGVGAGAPPLAVSRSERGSSSQSAERGRGGQGDRRAIAARDTNGLGGTGGTVDGGMVAIPSPVAGVAVDGVVGLEAGNGNVPPSPDGAGGGRSSLACVRWAVEEVVEGAASGGAEAGADYFSPTDALRVSLSSPRGGGSATASLAKAGGGSYGRPSPDGTSVALVGTPSPPLSLRPTCGTHSALSPSLGGAVVAPGSTLAAWRGQNSGPDDCSPSGWVGDSFSPPPGVYVSPTVDESVRLT